MGGSLSTLSAPFNYLVGRKEPQEAVKSVNSEDNLQENDNVSEEQVETQESVEQVVTSNECESNLPTENNEYNQVEPSTSSLIETNEMADNVPSSSNVNEEAQNGSAFEHYHHQIHDLSQDGEVNNIVEISSPVVESMPEPFTLHDKIEPHDYVSKMKNSRLNNRSSPIDRKRYHCEYIGCTASYTTKGSLKKHAQKVHFNSNSGNPDIERAKREQSTDSDVSMDFPPFLRASEIVQRAKRQRSSETDSLSSRSDQASVDLNEDLPYKKPKRKRGRPPLSNAEHQHIVDPKVLRTQ